MKKNMLVGLSLLALLGVGLLGCQNATSSTPDAIVGSWTNAPDTITFKNDNTLTITSTQSNGTGAGTWSKVESAYTVNIVTPSTVTATATISGTELTLTSTHGTTVYTRD